MAQKPKNSPLFEQMFGRKERNGRVISWDLADPNLVRDLVVAVNDAGGAVLFGATRDRGAWAITFFHDLVPKNDRTRYCNDEDEVNDFLKQWIEFWQAVVEEQKAPKKS